MKLKLQLAAACAAALALGTVHAQTTGPGLYIGGSIGQSKWKGDEQPGQDTSSSGGKIYGGYEFTPNFGLELGYVDLGKFDSSIGSVKANGPYLDAVGKFPFAPNWSALVRAGFFQGKLDVDQLGLSQSDHGTAAKYGLGVQYDMTRNTGIRLEYERYRFDTLNTKPNTDLLSLGVNYRF